jgi:hypothetical protein
MSLSDLMRAVETTLAHLPDPAGTAVRARFHHGDAAAVTPRWPKVVDRYLPAALAASGSHHGLAPALEAAARSLHWLSYDAYPADLIGPDFAAGHAFASLIGEEAAPFPAQDFDLGFFLVAPGLHYRDHRHPAPELYLPMTGPHGWRFDGAGGFAPLPAWVPVWNPPMRVHATQVGSVPFLALYAWTEHAFDPAEIVVTEPE